MLTLIIILYTRKVTALIRIRNFIKALKSFSFLKFIIGSMSFFVLEPGASFAQTLSQEFSFTIKRGNDSIGKLKATQLVNGNKTVRTLSSEYNVSFLFDFTLTEFTSDVFVNNRLLTSFMKRHINGKEKVHNTARWTGSGYELKKIDGEVTQMQGGVSHSVPSLYFDEPGNYNTVFSAFFHQILSVKKIDAHKYALQLPNGNQAYYTYNNGLLVNLEAHLGWTTLIFILDNPLASK